MRRSRADEPFMLVRSLASNARAGEQYPLHDHDWHQLIYASSGLLTVWTGRGSWIVPPSWAVWVPAGGQGVFSAGSGMVPSRGWSVGVCRSWQVTRA